MPRLTPIRSIKLVEKTSKVSLWHIISTNGEKWTDRDIPRWFGRGKWSASESRLRADRRRTSHQSRQRNPSPRHDKLVCSGLPAYNRGRSKIVLWPGSKFQSAQFCGVWRDCCAVLRHPLLMIRSRGNPRRLNPDRAGRLAP